MDFEELDLEFEGGVGGDDGREAARAVGVVGRAGEDGFLADGQLGDAWGANSKDGDQIEYEDKRRKTHPRPSP